MLLPHEKLYRRYQELEETGLPREAEPTQEMAEESEEFIGIVPPRLRILYYMLREILKEAEALHNGRSLEDIATLTEVEHKAFWRMQLLTQQRYLTVYSALNAGLLWRFPRCAEVPWYEIRKGWKVVGPKIKQGPAPCCAPIAGIIGVGGSSFEPDRIDPFAASCN